MSAVLVIGSGPDAVQARDWRRDVFLQRVVINNAWRVRDDWTHLIHPSDFPIDRQPQTYLNTQQIVTATDYVPIQNRYGGFVYAGGTMAFTAGYWALGALTPKVLGFVGCNMVYPKSGETHFYGTGTADPLRQDITLRSLPAKSARLMIMAAQQGCACVNLSTADSVLVFPRATPHTLPDAPIAFDVGLAHQALAEETRLGYCVPSGKYWKEESRFDPAAIDALDAIWLAAAGL